MSADAGLDCSPECPPRPEVALRALAEQGFMLVRFYGPNCDKCHSPCQAEQRSLESLLLPPGATTGGDQ